MEVLKILGLCIQRNFTNIKYLAQLNSQVNQTIALIRRIAARNKGLKETERIRLIQAFGLCLLTYSLPYLLPSRTELSKVNCLIRKT